MCTCSLWKLLFFKPLNSPITIILLIRFQKKSSEPLCPLTPQNAISPPKTSLYFCFVPCHSAGHKETPEHQLRETPYNTFILSPKEVIKKKKSQNQTKQNSTHLAVTTRTPDLQSILICPGHFWLPLPQCCDMHGTCGPDHGRHPAADCPSWRIKHFNFLRPDL